MNSLLFDASGTAGAGVVVVVGGKVGAAVLGRGGGTFLLHSQLWKAWVQGSAPSHGLRVVGSGSLFTATVDGGSVVVVVVVVGSTGGSSKF